MEPSWFTGRAEGEGGMPSVNRGALVPLALLPPPGTGGRSNGTGEDMLAVRLWWVGTLLDVRYQGRDPRARFGPQTVMLPALSRCLM